jgi:uncharacterized protein
MNSFKKAMLTSIGTISVVLGIIGVIIPLIPTTPLLLLGAACWFRASKRLHHWLLSNKWLGPYIKQYQDGLGIPLITKMYVITIMWISISVSALLIVPIIWVKIILFIIAGCITWYICSIKTLKKEGSVSELQIEKQTLQ